MSYEFRKAVRAQRYLRLCLFGPSGSGKTWSALALATAFSDRVAVIDTERSSASLYCDKFNFDVLSIDKFDVDTFISAIESGAKHVGTGGVLIIDGISPAWEARGGLLELVDSIKKQKRYANAMQAWADLKPIENRFWSALLDAPCHIIVTMRAKTAYEVTETDGGKKQFVKIGLDPIQRSGKEYEFDVVLRLEPDNTGIVEKSRCSEINDTRTFPKPNGNLSKILKRWLSVGAPDAPQAPQVPDDTEKKRELFRELAKMHAQLGHTDTKLAATDFIKHRTGKTPGDATLVEYQEAVEDLKITVESRTWSSNSAGKPEQKAEEEREVFDI